MSDLREEIIEAAQHFREADPKIARRQATSLIRAKRLLARLGIAAAVTGSKFKYQRAGIEPALLAKPDHASMLKDIVDRVYAGEETLADVRVEYLRTGAPMSGGAGEVIGRRVIVTLEGA